MVGGVTVVVAEVPGVEANLMRQLIDRRGYTMVPGAYDTLTARLVEQAGFAAVYLTGGGYSRANGYPDLGLLNQVLSAMGLKALTRDWLSDPDIALYPVIIAATWNAVGLPMLLYLAGLQTIPEELHEAAKVEGARPIQRFIYITFPLLRETTLVVLAITAINALKAYDIIGIPMVDVHASFLAPSHYSDEVVIESEVIEWRRSSFRVRHRLYNKGVLSVECVEVRVWAGKSAKDPEKIEGRPVPQEIIDRLTVKDRSEGKKPSRAAAADKGKRA